QPVVELTLLGHDVGQFGRAGAGGGDRDQAPQCGGEKAAGLVPHRRLRAKKGTCLGRVRDGRTELIWPTRSTWPAPPSPGRTAAAVTRGASGRIGRGPRPTLT